MTQNTILYSTAGPIQCLVAVPAAKPMPGSYNFVFPECPNMTVTELATLDCPHPTPTFAQVKVYKVELKGQQGVQDFNMVQPIAPQFLPLLAGKVNMISHPYSTTEFIHATAPVGGVDQLPLLIAVIDQSGSTGYHWEQHKTTAALKTESIFFPPQTSNIGAPGIRVFELTATEPGTFTTRFDLLAPGKHTIEASIVVNFQAYETK